MCLDPGLAADKVKIAELKHLQTTEENQLTSQIIWKVNPHLTRKVLSPGQMSTEFSKIGSIDSNVLVVTPPLKFELSATKHRDKTMEFLRRFDRERMRGIYT